MISRLKIEIRRCRPLLGTFVEITACGSHERTLHQAANAAFLAIDKIHRLMSPYDPASELTLLNREAVRQSVKVSAETYEVLRHADRMARQSAGAFDYTIAPTLARWGLLPENLKRNNPGCWRDVLLLPGRKVRFLRPLAVDLGGIAKGFAVDRAVETLCAAGVIKGLVNAGGDLRVFGPESATIHLRHPSCPQIVVRSVALWQSALATSSPCFSERCWHRKRVSHLVNPLEQRPIVGNVCATVRARECWAADALTKIVLNAPPQSASRLLEIYGAEGFVLTE